MAVLGGGQASGTVRDILIVAPSVAADCGPMGWASRFEEDPALPCLVETDAQEKPVRLIPRPKPGAAPAALTYFMTADVNEPLTTLARRLGQQGPKAVLDGIAVTDDGRYTGMIAGAALLAAAGRAADQAETALEEARRQTSAAMAKMSALQEQLIEAERERILYLTTYDALTGLPNRAAFGERLTEALGRLGDTAHGLEVIVVGINRFPDLSDAMGRDAAEQVLTALANRLKYSFAGAEALGRIGDAVFALAVLTRPEETPAGRLHARVTQALAAPLDINGTPVALAVSNGIARYPEDAGNAEELLQRALSALSRAKEQGLAMSYFSPGLDEAVRRRVRIGQELESALKGQRLALHYQRLVTLSDGKLVGAEALLRWPGTEGTELSPVEFIPIAERIGLIGPLGRWVLDEACAFAARLYKQGHRDIGVAVNISPVQFGLSNIVQDVTAALESSGLAPSLLHLEVTESAAMGDPERAQRTLNELKMLGVGLALDDFGTGHSSLALLKHLPVDRIKIDKSFLVNATRDADDAAILQTIIDLGNNLRLKVLAEGVETEAQCLLLQAMGCHLGQGTYFGPPRAEALFLEATASAMADD